MPKFASQLKKAFVGFDAAVAEETFARANQPHQRLGQAALRFVIIKIGSVNEFAGLLDQGFCYCGMRVTEGVNSDASAQIEIPFAGDVKDIAAGTVAQYDIEPAIAGNDVLLKQ